MIRPAEAEAEKVKILAIADAERTRIAAEAAASNNRVALDQLLIAQLPQIVKEAAAGLNGANVTVLNGADGLGEIAAGLVSQGLTILESVRKGVGVPPADGEADGPTCATVQGSGQGVTQGCKSKSRHTVRGAGDAEDSRRRFFGKAKRRSNPPRSLAGIPR